jgi:hypothetical protein
MVGGDTDEPGSCCNFPSSGTSYDQGRTRRRWTPLAALWFSVRVYVVGYLHTMTK